MARSYASGKHAIGECQRCGMKVPYRTLVMDGWIPGLRVCPRCRDIAHPAEKPVDTTDPQVLRKPAPDLGPAPDPVISSNSGVVVDAAPTTLTLQASASAINADYVGGTLTITAGLGIGQSRVVSAYDGTTKVATVPVWTITPDVSSTYEMMPVNANVISALRFAGSSFGGGT